MSNQTIGHIICPTTGRVAAVKRKKNGKKLPYLYNGKSNNFGDAESREKWLSDMKEVGAFGVAVGEFPEGVNSPASVDSKADGGEWKPDETCLPDGEHVDTEQNQVESANKQPKKSGWLGKVVLGATACALAVAGYKAFTN